MGKIKSLNGALLRLEFSLDPDLLRSHNSSGFTGPSRTWSNRMENPGIYNLAGCHAQGFPCAPCLMCRAPRNENNGLQVTCMKSPISCKSKLNKPIPTIDNSQYNDNKTKFTYYHLPVTCVALARVRIRALLSSSDSAESTVLGSLRKRVNWGWTSELPKAVMSRRAVLSTLDNQRQKV